MSSGDNTIHKAAPSALKLFISFLKIGAFTFGGGLAMLPLVRRELVQRERWLSDDEFLDIIGVAQCSPGPIAVNTAVFSGLRAMGLWGAFAATLGVVLPSLITLSVIAAVYDGFKSLTWAQRGLAGIRPAVAGLIAHAAWSLGRRSVRDARSIVVFTGITLASLVLRLHPALAIVIGGLFGAMGVKTDPEGGPTCQP